MSVALYVLGVVLLVPLLFMACDVEPQSDEPLWDDPLQPHIGWVLESINDEPVPPEHPPGVTFFETSIGGWDGCWLWGTYGDDDEEHPLKPILTYGDRVLGYLTVSGHAAMGFDCDDESRKLSEAFWDIMLDGYAFYVNGNRLKIFDVVGNSLEFHRMPPLSGRQPDLTRTHWQHGSGAILAFVDDTTVIGMSECEQFAWQYRTDGQLISFYFGLRLPVCWDCLHLCEGGDVVEGFSGVTQYAVDDQTLTLGYARDTDTFTAIPVPSVDFEEEWQLTNMLNFYPDPTAPTHTGIMSGELIPIEGSSITLNFENGMATGESGCGDYGATVAVDGENIVVSDVLKFGQPCSKADSGIQLQEDKYLSFLEQVEIIAEYHSRLVLSTGTGVHLIFE